MSITTLEKYIASYGDPDTPRPAVQMGAVLVGAQARQQKGGR